jgi:hypothetical protein
MLPQGRPRGLLAVFVLAVVLVSGCAAPSPPGGTSTEPAEEPTTSSQPSPASPGGTGLGAVQIGMSFDEAREAAGATPVADVCPWVATVAEDGFMTVIQRDQSGDDTSPVILVSASAPAEVSGAVGPRTPEGIGIGSTVEEARVAYPDAEELAPQGMGDRRYLKVASGEEGDVFLSFTDGGDRIWALTVTTLPVPPYEPCA